MTDARLTLFQADCEGAVSAELSLHGSRLVDRAIEAGDETSVHARIDGSELELFIDEDGAALQGPNTDLRFDASDFLNSADLIGEVVASIRLLADRGAIRRD